MVRMTDTTEFDNINGMTVARLRRWDICDEDNVADASSRRLYANLKQFYSKFKHFVCRFGANFFEAKNAMVLKFTPFPCLSLV